LRRGKIVALIGDNGSGKSTFVKIASGVYQPTRGSLALEG
jgi:ABC-type sugar transport system ATPase subunit